MGWFRTVELAGSGRGLGTWALGPGIAASSPVTCRGASRGRGPGGRRCRAADLDVGSIAAPGGHRSPGVVGGRLGGVGDDRLPFRGAWPGFPDSSDRVRRSGSCRCGVDQSDSVVVLLRGGSCPRTRWRVGRPRRMTTATRIRSTAPTWVGRSRSRGCCPRWRWSGRSPR